MNCPHRSRYRWWAAVGVVASLRIGPAASQLIAGVRLQDASTRIYVARTRAIGNVSTRDVFNGPDLILLGHYDARTRQYTGKAVTTPHGSTYWDLRGPWVLPAQGSARALLVRLKNPGWEHGGVTLKQQLSETGAAPSIRCGWAVGKVSAMRRGEIQDLRTGDAIEPGESMHTTPAAAAVLVLGADVIAILQPLTTLGFREDTRGSTPVEDVRLPDGRAWFAVRRLGDPRGLDVRIGGVTLRSHGGESAVSSGLLRISVVVAEGSVEVSDEIAPGATIHVAAGHRWERARAAETAPPPALADLRPVADEWDELLAMADYCWPYRREFGKPFWEDRVDPPAKRAHGRLDPLALAPLVWDPELTHGDSQASRPQRRPRPDNPRGPPRRSEVR